MARELPAYVDAKRDRAIRGNAFYVYLWCDEHLDTVEYRRVKHSVIETALGLSDSSVAAAINLLVARGYLARGPRQGRLWCYRLYHSRSSEAAIPAPTGAVTVSL